MCLNERRFDRDSHIDNILLEFACYKLLVSVCDDDVRWSQVCIDSTCSKLISNVSCWNIFQSFVRLKTNRLVYYMQNEFIIVSWFSFHIQYVYHDIVIKLNIFISYWKDETIRRFFMPLTVMWWDALWLWTRRSDRDRIARVFRINGVLMSDQIDDVDDAIRSRLANMNFSRWTRESKIEWAFFIREKRDRIVEWREDVFRAERSHWSNCWNRCLIHRNRSDKAKTECWFLLYETWSSQVKCLARRTRELMYCRFSIWYLT